MCQKGLEIRPFYGTNFSFHQNYLALAPTRSSHSFWVKISARFAICDRKNSRPKKANVVISGMWLVTRVEGWVRRFFIMEAYNCGLNQSARGKVKWRKLWENCRHDCHTKTSAMLLRLWYRSQLRGKKLGILFLVEFARSLFIARSRESKIWFRMRFIKQKWIIVAFPRC